MSDAKPESYEVLVGENWTARYPSGHKYLTPDFMSLFMNMMQASIERMGTKEYWDDFFKNSKPYRRAPLWFYRYLALEADLARWEDDGGRP